MKYLDLNYNFKNNQDENRFLPQNPQMDYFWICFLLFAGDLFFWHSKYQVLHQ